MRWEEKWRNSFVSKCECTEISFNCHLTQHILMYWFWICIPVMQQRFEQWFYEITCFSLFFTRNWPVMTTLIDARIHNIYSIAHFLTNCSLRSSHLVSGGLASTVCVSSCEGPARIKELFLEGEVNKRVALWQSSALVSRKQVHQLWIDSQFPREDAPQTDRRTVWDELEKALPIVMTGNRWLTLLSRFIFLHLFIYLFSSTITFSSEKWKLDLIRLQLLIYVYFMH